jgi:hypothetical protein
MKSLITKQVDKTTKFELGDLVISKEPMFKGYIVLVTSSSNLGDVFNGVCIVRGLSVCAPGVYEKSFRTNDFELFSGEIKLTQ